MKEWKKVILYAIIPALIAGVFAVSPKLYDEFTEPKAVLEYFINRGPIIKTEGSYKSIYSIDVNNKGRKPLSKVYASIKSKGVVEAVNTYESTGLSPEIKAKSPIITVETLHPGEGFTISFMLVTTDDQNKIDFILRSQEVLGYEFKPADPKKTKKLDLASAMATAVSVFSMAVFVMFRVKSGKSLGSFVSDKPNFLYYIAATLGLLDITRSYGISEGSITYMRFGDMLYSIGKGGEPEEKEKALIALKCMLLNSTMAEVSRQCIIRNIKALSDDEYSEEEIDLLASRSCSATKLIELREMIDEFIANPAAFLTQPDSPNN
jgi:hypothetical protein